MAGDIASLVTGVGGAVGALFGAEGNAAQAADFTGAANLATQNAQLAAASTRIQETQTVRAVNQSLGTTQADVAGAGFTMSGSALDLMKSSAQQGSLAASLVNIQGAMNENSYAAQAGAYTGEATAAKEANKAGTVNAIASLGGALIGNAGQLASAGKTVAQGVDYVSGLFSGSSALTDSQITANALGNVGYVDEFASATDASLSEGAALYDTSIGVDTSQVALGTAGTDVTAGISDAIASGLGAAGDVVASIGSGIAEAAAAAASTAAEIGSAVVEAGSAALDVLSTVGEVLSFALCVICTAFYRRGMVDRKTWAGAQRFGYSLDPYTFAGYVRWASPIADRIKKSQRFANWMAPIFIPPVEEMAIIMGYREKSKRTIYGVISHRVLLGLSWSIGQMIKRRRYVEARA